ncbi:hypothetical protein, partial [Cronobacter sakazakii]|uniref:hypothetical protein n=1 Tax=Cronobacter sakazakii TaxID=28141 RepID=UPI001F507447
KSSASPARASHGTSKAATISQRNNVMVISFATVMAGGQLQVFYGGCASLTRPTKHVYSL